MLKHYLKIAVRNALKNRVLTFAKLFGISVSFAVVMFTAGYIFYETSFDKFIPDYDNIYRLYMHGRLNGNDIDFAVTSPRMAEVLIGEVPEISETLRLKPYGETVIEYSTGVYNSEQIHITDTNFFTFFKLPVDKTINNPLESRNYVTIAKSLAVKYFGTVGEALNKTIKLYNTDFTITGVFKDLPVNSHLQGKVFLSIEHSNYKDIGWQSQNYFTYIKTNTNKIVNEELNFKVSKAVYNHSDEGIDGDAANSWEDLKWSDDTFIFYSAESLKELHFGNHRFDMVNTSNKTYVYGAIILALLVLGISTINYINLSFSNVSRRYKEIGLLKTNGAKTKLIVAHFLVESTLFWITGFILALIIYLYVGDKLTDKLGFEVHLSQIQVIKNSLLLFAFLLVFNVSVNILPILRVANIKIVGLLKENRLTKRRISYQEGFVFLQFIISTIIIICSLIVHKQVDYIINADRGYNTENVITLNLWEEFNKESRETFAAELKRYPEILSVSASEIYFGTDPGMRGAHFDAIDEENYFHATLMPVTTEFIKTFNLKMLEGRFFEENRKADINTVVINRAAANSYMHEGAVIGKTLFLNNNEYEIIGVTENFNFRSLHHEIQPLILTCSENWWNLFVKVETGNVKKVIDILQDQWDKFNVKRQLNYTFHDEVLAINYENDQQAKSLLLWLAIISISISCVGLYAISHFTIVKKIKEFAIRKINGAKVYTVAYEFSRRFILIVLTSFLISAPIAWYLVYKWLQNFAYKVEIRWWVFALVGVLTVTIALLTILSQTWIASRKNPVEALRYE